ncbi:MAG: copper amine oxidase N-terminal domain-containing protein [Tissierellia bacterium]|nr:copper amine oxidase N-terminal domain-containing protein [Tissierellia bacterium]
MKKICISIVLVLMLLTSVIHGAGIRLWVSGHFVEGEVPPFVENERTMVPLRLISETFGYQVEWIEATQQVRITGDKTIVLQLGVAYADIDGMQIPLEVAPVVREERTFVPLRFIAETFGHRVDWDQEHQVAIIGEGYVAGQGTEVAETPAVQEDEEETVQTSRKEPFIPASQFANGRIIGNKKSMKYHCPHMRDYHKVKFENAVFFDTEEEAKAAGYVRAKQ